MLLLVESFDSIAGSIVVPELRLVFNFIEFGLVVPHPSFYDVHCKERRAQDIKQQGTASSNLRQWHRMWRQDHDH